MLAAFSCSCCGHSSALALLQRASGVTISKLSRRCIHEAPWASALGFWAAMHAHDMHTASVQKLWLSANTLQLSPTLRPTRPCHISSPLVGLMPPRAAQAPSSGGGEPSRRVTRSATRASSSTDAVAAAGGLDDCATSGPASASKQARYRGVTAAAGGKFSAAITVRLAA